MNTNSGFRYPVILCIAILVSACSLKKEKKEVTLYNHYCGSCHMLPNINDLPKHIWESEILPDMGARMGIRDSLYDPYKDVSLAEQGAMIETGIYPYKPIIPITDWDLLKRYILELAPDKLPKQEAREQPKELEQFAAKPISLDNQEGTFITYLEFNKQTNEIRTGDMRGNLYSYNYKNDSTTFQKSFRNPITSYTQKDHVAYATLVGFLNPSEIASGGIVVVTDDKANIIKETLHRPVHTLVHDFNKDGNNELIVSEFGDLTGKLSLLVKDGNGQYKKTVLLPQPGALRILAKDMNNDSLDDIVVMTSQGNEGITVLYQKANLTFSAEQVIRFSPVYGSSWFELIDYDGDGHDDIITVNGDNADKSYVQKPYHGMRIHINDGKNNFEEKYFYPLNGATRVVAADFDEDGDIDFALVASFPDYELDPAVTFVYLENKMADKFVFQPYTFKESNLGRWFLLDKGDVDNDGDLDLILSSFTYEFAPVPSEIMNFWKAKNVDLLILENKLITETK